jgi:hypothetical protein
LRTAARADVLGREVILGAPLGDISLGGCRFEGRAWELHGSDLQLLVTFERTGTALMLTGKVVRAGERDMGVRFGGLSDDQKWALRKALRDAQAPETSGAPSPPA